MFANNAACLPILVLSNFVVTAMRSEGNFHVLWLYQSCRMKLTKRVRKKKQRSKQLKVCDPGHITWTRGDMNFMLQNVSCVWCMN